MSRNTFRLTSGRTAPSILFVLITLITLITLIAPASVVAPKSFAATNRITLPLSTSGNTIVDARGSRVILQGVNWFGFETANHAPHGLWIRDYKDMLKQIKQQGFNTIRIPFSLAALKSSTTSGIDYSNGKNAALAGKTPQQVMDIIIKEAGRLRLMVILDNHSQADDGFMYDLWYGQDGYTESDWISTWSGLAKRYARSPQVIGADLKNEPHGRATWGTGPSYTASDAPRTTDGFYYVCVPGAFLAGSFSTTAAAAVTDWVGTRDGASVATTFDTGTCGTGATGSGLVGYLDPFGYSAPLFALQPRAVPSPPSEAIPTQTTPEVTTTTTTTATTTEATMTEATTTTQNTSNAPTATVLRYPALSVGKSVKPKYIARLAKFPKSYALRISIPKNFPTGVQDHSGQSHRVESWYVRGAGEGDISSRQDQI
jgi:hypothetical protein